MKLGIILDKHLKPDGWRNEYRRAAQSLMVRGMIRVAAPSVLLVEFLEPMIEMPVLVKRIIRRKPPLALPHLLAVNIAIRHGSGAMTHGLTTAL